MRQQLCTQRPVEAANQIEDPNESKRVPIIVPTFQVSANWFQNVGQVFCRDLFQTRVTPSKDLSTKNELQFQKVTIITTISYWITTMVILKYRKIRKKL
jgi:hypothetical protein